jgi:hypothetical protein
VLLKVPWRKRCPFHQRNKQAAAGHPAAVEQGLNMIRKLGTFVDWTIIGESKELHKGIDMVVSSLTSVEVTLEPRAKLRDCAAYQPL